MKCELAAMNRQEFTDKAKENELNIVGLPDSARKIGQFFVDDLRRRRFANDFLLLKKSFKNGNGPKWGE